MDVKAFTLLMFVSQFKTIHSTDVSGIITENVTFFYRKLPVAPSMRATIEFNISYSQSSMRGKRPWPLMGIYTEYPTINIQERCSKIIYGQLHNENLHPFLRIPEYRTTKCELSGSDTVNCRGKVTVQDFIPRNFSLSFGFECHSFYMNSLKGLRYNITFSNQSNKTNKCIKHVSHWGPGVCGGFYQQTSLPNLVGGEQLDKILVYLMVIEAYQADLQYERCHQHMLEILCHVMLPECDPVTQHVIHPYRETCLTLSDVCWQTWLSLAAKLLRIYGLKWDDPTGINCTYLPSVHGSIPCFYKNVTCDSPPDATNSTMMVNATQKDVYQLHDVVQYACVNETFEMRGNDLITCLYSGQWSHFPPKCLPAGNSGIKFVYFVLPIIFVLLLALFIFIGITYKRKTSANLKEEEIQLDNTLVLLTDTDDLLLTSKRKQESTLSLDSVPLLRRNREFDAFVIYRYDADHGFVTDTLIPQLEEATNLKLKIHSRDFEPGRKIDENIEEAIKSSNNAIVLMSAGFTTSEWCADEFTHCYIEHVEDPAFKLFIIVMEPVGILTDMTLNMKKVLKEQTYLELQDPDLFTKLSKYLKSDDDSDTNDSD